MLRIWPIECRRYRSRLSAPRRAARLCRRAALIAAYLGTSLGSGSRPAHAGQLPACLEAYARGWRTRSRAAAQRRADLPTTGHARRAGLQPALQPRLCPRGGALCADAALGRACEDPTALLATPSGRSLPKALSESAVDAAAARAGPLTREGAWLRDRAMLDDDGAARVSELVSLHRAAPISAKGRCASLARRQGTHRAARRGGTLLDGALSARTRAVLAGGRVLDALFPGARAQEMTRRPSGATSSSRADRRLDRSGHAATDLLASFATHLLNHGADLRALQLRSGTAASRPRRYTFVAREGLKLMHGHPSSPRLSPART